MTTRPRSAVRRLFVSRVISLTGGAAAFLALNFYIYRRTGSTAWLAAALVLTFGASGLAAPFAGALGDRFDRRRVMIASDLLGAAAFLAMSLVRSPGPLLGLAFLSALAEAPFFSASAAAIPNLVSDDDLAWANGMVAVGRNAGIVLGPILGGLLFSAVGAGAVFAMNGATFVLSAALVVSVHGQFSGARDGDGEGEGEFTGLRAGFRYLWTDRVLRTVTFAWLVLVLGLGMTMVADVPLVGLFGAGSFGYGILIAFWGAGSIVGSLAGRRLRARTEPAALVGGSAVVAITCIAVGVSPWFGLVLGAILAMGIGDGFSLVANQGIMQRRTPDAVRSRVSGAMETFVHGGLALSYVVGGPVVAALGPRAAYVLGGVAALIGVVIAGAGLRPSRMGWGPKASPPPTHQASELLVP